MNGEKTTIVAFGDSITAGYFKSGDEFHSEKDEGAVYYKILDEKLRYISTVLLRITRLNLQKPSSAYRLWIVILFL